MKQAGDVAHNSNMMEWAEAIFLFFEKNKLLTVALLFVLSLGLRLLFVDYQSLLAGDNLGYFLRSLQIANGNFAPDPSQAIGLPLATAPFFYLFGSQSILANMAYAKILSVVISSLMIFPLFMLSKRLLNPIATFLVLVFFVFYSSLVDVSGLFLTESLFSALFLLAIVFTVDSFQKPARILYAFLFAGLAYYVRPNGLFVFVIVALSYLLVHFKNLRKNLGFFMLGIAVFWIVAAPFLFARWHAFGSAFSYGENSKFFVDSYKQVWAPNIPVPSLFHYLSTHSPQAWANKFIAKGLIKLVIQSCHQLCSYGYSTIVSPLLLVFFFYGLIKNRFNKAFWPIYLSLILFIAGLSLVYSVFPFTRHLTPLIPFVLVVSAAGLEEVARFLPNKYRFLTMFLIIFIIFSLVSPIVSKTFNKEVVSMPVWAPWVAKNLTGNVVANFGQGLVLMNLPDANVSRHLPHARSNLKLILPGAFNHIDEAMDYFYQNKASYVLSHDDNERRPYLNEMALPQYQAWFTRIYSNEGSSDSAKIEVYKINWDAYKRSQLNSQNLLK